MKYKGYELMKAVSEGKLNLKQKVSTTSLEYKNCTIEFVLKDKAFNIMDLDFELIDDEIKEGEYIRTKAGCIYKITGIDENGRCSVDYCGDFSGLDKYQVADIIKKHSKNIVDLIEINDIVHTRDVFNYDYCYMYDESFIRSLKEDIKNGIRLVEILTHEQYEKNYYKMEEEE